MISADTQLTSIVGDTVNFDVFIRLQDESNTDDYGGFITAFIIAVT